MSIEEQPATAAARVLHNAGISYTNHFYAYSEGGGTAAAARELNVDEHSIVKTLVLEADGKRPLLVLMHGDMRASTKELARIAGAQVITPCLPGGAAQYTGYPVGGISPFGTRTEMPVFMEETILNLRKVYINGGQQGYLIGLDPYDAVKVLQPIMVKIGTPRHT